MSLKSSLSSSFRHERDPDTRVRSRIILFRVGKWKTATSREKPRVSGLSTWTLQTIFERNYSQMAEKSVRVSIRSRDGGEIPTRTCKKKKQKKNKERPSIFSLLRLATRCVSINCKSHYKDWNLSRGFSRTFSCVASRCVYTNTHSPLFACIRRTTPAFPIPV